MAQAFYSTVRLPTPLAALDVQVGFIPGLIQLTNLSQVSVPVATHGFKAMWQSGMVDGSAIITAYSGALADMTSFVAAPNGISLLNPLGFEQAQYGATISGFSNAANGVITVDSTARLNIALGSKIRVAALADNQTGTGGLNGDYDVLSITATTITVVQSTVGKAVYVSGGFVTVLQNSLPTVPNPPFNIYSNVPTWFNSAIQGFTIGTGVFPNATANDLILIAAFDSMQP